MINRVASYDNFNSVVSDLSRTQVKIDGNQEGLASGKRVERAGDDPVASIAIQNAKQEQKEIKSYLSNTVLANNRLSNEESVIPNIEETTVSFKKRLLQLISGSLSQEDKEAYRQELDHFADEIYDLGNSRDEAGHYIFAGGRTSSPAFSRDNNSVVTFKGDTNVPYSAISSTVTLPTADSGRNVFYRDNPFGDFQPDYQLNEASVLALYTAETTLPEKNNYTVLFKENPDTGMIEYELWDKEELRQRNIQPPPATSGEEQAPQPQPLQSGEFRASENIIYQPDPNLPQQRLSIQIEGYPIQEGDRVDLNYQPEISVFDVLNMGIDEAESVANDATRTAQMNTVIRQVDSSFVHFNQVRSDIGSRLQTLDTQRNMLEDFDLELEKTKGSLEDLDYTATVVDYSKNTTALEAAQKAFSRTQQLSLFQYI